MIRTLLIANRGEIACRIICSCRRMGIRPVAVFSDADASALHVRSADAAVRIGPAPARDSYLVVERLIEAARTLRADAIHPGYGFLSEKPALARACVDAGLVFVGPSADRIAAMGDKAASKALAAAAGVPGVPGYSGEDQSTARFAAEAEAIGFPVMVKASAGGGGKGMRLVADRTGLAAAVDLARREAEAAFGDARLILEKAVIRPRHLEVQVAGDRHGNRVHLFERDCSVQRNHQKVLEEAPAPNLPEPVRQALLDRAIALADSINYDNLGTVEFILGEGAQEPWFLEMNTRLQVEHPVTEAITGQDLVEWQIRIAAGETLPLRQEQIRAHGHAIEARVTAERAEAGFRPETGTIAVWAPPNDVRIDSGFAEGDTIPSHYDSLLAKVIATGPDRASARQRLEAALREFAVLGPATTLPFLADAVAAPAFAAGLATTAFITETFPQGWQPPQRHAALAVAAAAVLRVLDMAARTAAALPNGSPWAGLPGFRIVSPARVPLVLVGGPAAVLALGGDRWRVEREQDAAPPVTLTLARTGHAIVVEADGTRLAGHALVEDASITLWLDGEVHAIPVQTALEAAGGAAATGRGSGTLLAPMPGVVAELRVAEGDTVAAGDVLVVLESMKLFMPLAAETAGTVAEIGCRPGETVPAGRVLLVIRPAPA